MHKRKPRERESISDIDERDKDKDAKREVDVARNSLLSASTLSFKQSESMSRAARS